MLELKKRLARLLIEKSYLEGDFTLTSGQKSDYYFDCKHTALHPEGAWLIGKFFLDMIRAKGGVQGVGGMTLGADPLVSAVTVVSHLEGYPLPGFIIRKQPKGHGTNQYLEGLKNFTPGMNVCLLEDVITTGGTLLKAVDRVREQTLTEGGDADVMETIYRSLMEACIAYEHREFARLREPATAGSAA